MNDFILQCKNCNTILAISQNYVNDPFQTPHDAFHLGANVCKGTDILVSNEINDQGAKYCDLSCNKCNKVVGKVYEEIVPSVANLKKLFLFRKTMTTKFRPQLSLIPNVKQIPSNNTEQNTKNENLNGNYRQQNIRNTDSNTSHLGRHNIVNSNGGIVGKSEEEIYKLQSVILNLNERLSKLEQTNERFKARTNIL